MAEIADIASQLVRVDIVRDQQRAAEGRQGDRAREEAAGEVRDGNASVIRRNIDLSADAAFDPVLPRGSIVDIIA